MLCIGAVSYLQNIIKDDQWYTVKVSDTTMLRKAKLLVTPSGWRQPGEKNYLYFY
jgi:hypothetical protein